MDYPNYSIPQELTTFADSLLQGLSKEAWFIDEYLTLFKASQFTRMFPFKLAREPRLGILFMLHAISLIKTIKC
jgi:hypothetical protein